MTFVENIINAIDSTTLMEKVAVISGLLYLICISLKWVIAWFFAILSAGLYMYLCYVSQLYLETGLQSFYLLLGIFGWYMWAVQEPDSSTIIRADDTIDLDLGPSQSPIIRWSKKSHVINLSVSLVLMFTLGFIFDQYTDQANPYTDAFSTIFSLVATYMVTKKVLENWLYWIVIDIAGIYMFASRELYLTSALYLVYLIVAIFGFFKWRKLMRMQG